MWKQGLKTINAKFVCNLFVNVHYPKFFCPVQTIGNLFPKSESYTFVQDLRWRKSRGYCFECRLFINFCAIILLKRNMTEKDVCRAHTFSSLDCNFSFCPYFLQLWWLLNIKKEQIRFPPSSLNSFITFLFIWFKGLSFKTQFNIEFWPPVDRVQLMVE